MRDGAANRWARRVWSQPEAWDGAAVGLVLGQHDLGDQATVVMGIVNRTPDSFYDTGSTFSEAAALDRVDQVVAEGADVVDIGGVRAGYGDDVDEAEEIRRTATLVAQVRSSYPGLVISVDTWRSEVARVLCEAGADLINDSWAGSDPRVAATAAEFDVGLVCSHTGGLAPRTAPHRVAYDDVMADVVHVVTGLAERAVSLGVRRDAILVDPTHDFGKNTWQSLEVTRRLGQLVEAGWPVLVALSNKDFIGETLGLPGNERLNGTLAATAVSAWQGARVFRVHEVAPTRQVLDMVASIRGHRPPSHAVRGLA